MNKILTLYDVYKEPVDPAPPTEIDLDEVIVWYEKIKENDQKRYCEYD